MTKSKASLADITTPIFTVMDSSIILYGRYTKLIIRLYIDVNVKFKNSELCDPNDRFKKDQQNKHGKKIKNKVSMSKILYRPIP